MWRLNGSRFVAACHFLGLKQALGLSLGLLLCLFVGFGLPQPAWAETAANQIPLTLELLQDRLVHPTQMEGSRTIDLSRMVIDLRAENEAFRERFYTLLQADLQGQGSPLGLDLSYSIIQGDFDLGRLGLRVPLYGQALAPIFSEPEQKQLDRDRRRLTQLNQLSRSLLIQTQPIPIQINVFRGPLKLAKTQFTGGLSAAETFFLSRVEAQGADFQQTTNWTETRFSQSANFAGAIFEAETRFRSSIFFSKARFNQVTFCGTVNFQGSEFQETANFNRAEFQKFADLSRIEWQGNADFAKTVWHGSVSFTRDQYRQSLFLTEATFNQALLLREARFNKPANLRSVSILAQADFGDTSFAPGAYLNISGLQFNPEEAEILGNPGQVSRSLSVPTLQGNETLLRNLVRNFRNQEQIADANQIEYMTERLRIQDIQQRLLGTNINRATIPRLMRLGFSDNQARAIASHRAEQSFSSTSDLLRLDEIDLATYVKVRDRVIAGKPLTLTGWMLNAMHWLELSLLLLLSRYGTSFWLAFGVGLVSLAYFGLLFWLVDRVRRHQTAEGITLPETGWMLSSFALLMTGGISAIVRASERPTLTLLGLSVLIVPIPALLIGWRYRQAQDPMDRSYFVEDSSLRQLRVLIGRLPIMPRFSPFFRDRYQPILWERRWGWLNYYDFSLNNLLKFGFNDIRIRDEQMPGLITALVWYQWSLGLLYFTLLLWTLSRTIPGLNLLIYFK